VDQAAIQIASGYNTTDPVARKAFLDQAFVLLHQYSALEWAWLLKPVASATSRGRASVCPPRRTKLVRDAAVEGLDSL
jgi:hypothetical protein